MRKIYHFIFAATLLLQTAISFADDNELSILPNVEISTRQFDYVSNDNTVAGDIVTAGLGLSLTYQRFYANIRLENSLSSDNENASGFVGNDSAISFRRSDFTLSTGYALENTFILFAGYKQGKTTIDASTANASSSIELVGRGFFIGAGAGAKIRDWGVLSFSAAYADLDSEYQDAQNPSLNGHASGTSLSVSWKSPLTNNWSYQLALVRHDYAYAGFPRSNLRIQENILSLRLSLAYRF